jgi:mono/diheme cytochrome c family protein
MSLRRAPLELEGSTKSGLQTMVKFFTLIGANLILMGQAAALEPYEKHCAKCHASAGRLARKLEGATAEEKAAKLGRFLETHQKLDPEIRSKLVDYLAGLPSP